MLQQEPLDVREPPGHAMGKVAELWKPTESGRIVCTACARYCKIGEGQVGLCGIRGVHDGKLWLYTYGKVITGHVDPIEKKPVTHYRPGSKIFSIATTGCNWLCHPSGTPILMEDGDVRPVEEIQAGDALWSLGSNGWSVPDIVTAIGTRRASIVRASVRGIREPLLGTPEHPVLATRGWLTLAQLRPGDFVLGTDGVADGPRVQRPTIPEHSVEVHPEQTATFWRHYLAPSVAGPSFRWSEITGVRTEGTLDSVYSFECVPFHNYVASGVVVHNCRYCFLPGTRVATDRGFEPIEEVYAKGTPTDSPEIRSIVDRKALTHQGRMRPITQAFEHPYAGKILRIEVNGGAEIPCTPDHNIFVRDAGGELRKTRADEVRVRDLLVVPLPQISEIREGLERELERVATTITTGTGALLLAPRVRAAPGAKHGYIDVPVTGIREESYVGPVYNLEVEEDHSYTANCIAVSNCQNFDISQRRKIEGIDAQPEDIVRMTVEQGCQGLAYTYNQPTIFIEFARDIGVLARKAGLMNIFVSNGYDTPEAVAEMKPFLDCITVDFKGSGETGFVRKYISIPNADPIFSTLKDLRDHTKIHTEITDLIVPEVGDDLEAARKLSKFVYDELGPDTPIHFLRFHPDYKMNDLPWTPVETLEKHCAVAKAEGLRYVYMGNVPGHPLEHTYCPGCGAVAIRRYGFDITGWNLTKDNRCKACDYQLPIHGSLEKTVSDERYYSVLRHR